MDELRKKFRIPVDYIAAKTKDGRLLFMKSDQVIAIDGESATFFYGALFAPWRPCEMAS